LYFPPLSLKARKKFSRSFVKAAIVCCSAKIL
jgi:hypothetical protein